MKMKMREDVGDGRVKRRTSSQRSREEPPTNPPKYDSQIPEGPEVSTDSPWTQRKVLKNLILISVGIFLLFSAYEGLVTLQSTMNSSGGVGVVSEATMYAFVCISALTLPKFVIQKLGCKRTLFLCMITFYPFIASNFYPHWATLIPSAVILGLGASVLWTSNSCYINGLCLRYSLCNEDSLEAINSRFFGVASMFFLGSYILGNILSSIVLLEDTVDVATRKMNATLISCGIDFCGPEKMNPNLREISQGERYILTTAYLTCCVVATFLVAFLLDELPKEKETEKATDSTVNVFMSTLRLMKHIDQLLMMPMAFYLGIAEGFYFTDYTKAYVACAWGVYHIGYVSICYGVLCAVSSSLSGLLVKYVGRIPIFLTMGTVNMVAIGLLSTWTAKSFGPIMFFVLAGMWGLFVGAFRSLILALYGFLFHEDEEAAFANYHLWNSLGFCASFAYSYYLCTITKMFVVTGFYCFAILGYMVLELKLIWTRKDVVKYNPSLTASKI